MTEKTPLQNVWTSNDEENRRLRAYALAGDHDGKDPAETPALVIDIPEGSNGNRIISTSTVSLSAVVHGDRNRLTRTESGASSSGVILLGDGNTYDATQADANVDNVSISGSGNTVSTGAGDDGLEVYLAALPRNNHVDMGEDQDTARIVFGNQATGIKVRRDDSGVVTILTLDNQIITTVSGGERLIFSVGAGRDERVATLQLDPAVAGEIMLSTSEQGALSMQTDLPLLNNVTLFLHASQPHASLVLPHSAASGTESQ